MLVICIIIIYIYYYYYYEHVIFLLFIIGNCIRYVLITLSVLVVCLGVLITHGIFIIYMFNNNYCLEGMCVWCVEVCVFLVC